MYRRIVSPGDHHSLRCDVCHRVWQAGILPLDHGCFATAKAASHSYRCRCRCTREPFTSHVINVTGRIHGGRMYYPPFGLVALRRDIFIADYKILYGTLNHHSIAHIEENARARTFELFSSWERARLRHVERGTNLSQTLRQHLFLQNLNTVVVHTLLPVSSLKRFVISSHV